MLQAEVDNNQIQQDFFDGFPRTLSEALDVFSAKVKVLQHNCIRSR
jgi:hypothetical protein